MNKFRCEIHESRQDESSFIVALLSVPNFPDDKPCKEIVRMPLQAVIAANDDSGEWGFCILDADEKNCIGSKLNELGVKECEWKYCNLYYS